MKRLRRMAVLSVKSELSHRWRGGRLDALDAWRQVGRERRLRGLFAYVSRQRVDVERPAASRAALAQDAKAVAAVGEVVVDSHPIATLRLDAATFEAHRFGAHALAMRPRIAPRVAEAARR